MTSGTIIDDKRTTFAGMCGTVKAGYQYRKTWSGADKPLTPKMVRPNEFYSYYVWKTNRKGQTYRVIHRHQKMRPRAPKVVWERGEHPYSMSLSESRDPIVAWRIGTSGPFNRTGTVDSCFGGASWPQPWTANDDIKLIQKLREQLVGSDFDMGVFLGTAHQSLYTIAQSAVRIAAAMRNVRKGNIAAAAKDLMGSAWTHKGRATLKDRSAKSLSDAWLELQYGWKPLVKDIFSGAEFLANQLNRNAEISYRVGRRLKGTPVSSSPSNTAVKSGYCYQSKRIIARFTEKPSFATLAGLRNPESIAWELMPWSFVADWVLPIGDYLQARSFAGGLNGKFITSFKTEASIRGIKSVPGSNTPMEDGAGDSYFVRSVTLDRTISTSLVVPFPVVKPLAKIATWGHAQNALALLTQVAYRTKATYNRKLAAEAREIAVKSGWNIQHQPFVF